jgi:hypothetical protein
MSLSSIITQIETVIESVSGIGQTHDYRRYSHDEATFKRLHKSGSKVNTWQIYRTETQELSGAEEGGSLHKDRDVHAITIEGFMSLKDSTASEKTFRTIIEGIRDALRLKQTLSGACFVIRSGPDVTQDSEMYNNVLCHHCLVTLAVEELVTIGV